MYIYIYIYINLLFYMVNICNVRKLLKSLINRPPRIK